jgi:lactate permease
MNVSSILAFQTVGGAMGNMICINNIVAVCSVLGISGYEEGFILKRTVIPMVIYGIIVAIVGTLLFAV